MRDPFSRNYRSEGEDIWLPGGTAETNTLNVILHEKGTLLIPPKDGCCMALCSNRWKILVHGTQKKWPFHCRSQRLNLPVPPQPAFLGSTSGSSVSEKEDVSVSGCAAL